QHLDVRPERWFGEGRQQALQNGVERGYARKHGRGPPCPLRASCDAGKSRKVYKEPRPLCIIKIHQKICESSGTRNGLYRHSSSAAIFLASISPRGSDSSKS